MATERLEMDVLREIFRQKLTLQRSHRQVVKALGVSIGKVSGALARAAAIELDAEGVERLTDAELEAALYPKTVAASFVRTRSNSPGSVPSLASLSSSTSMAAMTESVVFASG